MEDNLALNIVFMPPSEVSDFAISQCEEVSRDTELSFKLDGINNLPHITIYQLIIPEKQLTKLVDFLESFVGNINSLVFRFTKYNEHNGFIGASFLASQEIKNIQAQIIQATSPLREGRNVLESDDAVVESFFKEQKQTIQEFGSANLLEFYDPHITVSRVVDIEQAKKIELTLDWKFPESKIESLGLYTLGDFGTCNELIKEFKLKAAD